MAGTKQALMSLVAVSALAGCSTNWRPITDGTIGMVPAKAMVADYRLATVQANPKDLKEGAHNPILCAEPSPDVARAFSSALSASLSGGYSKAAADGSTRNVDVAAALQYQTSQTIAQLGKRYATVQILRDVLHAQCMQYANGTMSESTWAIMQSRFNSLVVTLLALEMASGDTAPAPVNVVAKVGADGKPAEGSGDSKGGDGKGSDDGSGSKPAVPTVQQYTAAAGAVDDAQAQYYAFASAVNKLVAAEKAAATPAPAASAASAVAAVDAGKPATKAAAKEFQAVQTQLKKAVDALTAAWTATTKDQGAPTAATKDKIAAFTKSVPAKDDKAVAAAAAGAASSPSAKESKAASETMASAVEGLAKANARLVVLSPVASPAAPKPAAMPKADLAGSAAGSEVRASAVAMIHANYTQREDLGPSLLGCFSLLDPPGPAAEANDRNVSPLLAAYCQAALQSRIDAANKLAETDPKTALTSATNALTSTSTSVRDALTEQTQNNWLTYRLKPNSILSKQFEDLIKGPEQKPKSPPEPVNPGR